MHSALSLATGLIAALPVAANARMCAERAVLTDALAAQYGERFDGGGLRDSQSILEVWVSDETGTWTLLLTQPDGTSCIMASGTGWRDALPAELMRGTPS